MTFNCQAKTNITSSICPGFIPAWSVYTCMVSVGTLCTDCKMFGWKLSWTIKYSSFCQWIRQCSHETYTSPHCEIDLEDTKPFFCSFLFSFCMMLKFMTVHHQLGQKKASGSEDTEQYRDTWTGRTVILITHCPPTYPFPHYYNFTTGGIIKLQWLACWSEGKVDGLTVTITCFHVNLKGNAQNITNYQFTWWCQHHGPWNKYLYKMQFNTTPSNIFNTKPFSMNKTRNDISK